MHVVGVCREEGNPASGGYRRTPRRQAPGDFDNQTSSLQVARAPTSTHLSSYTYTQQLLSLRACPPHGSVCSPFSPIRQHIRGSEEDPSSTPRALARPHQPSLSPAGPKSTRQPASEREMEGRWGKAGQDRAGQGRQQSQTRARRQETRSPKRTQPKSPTSQPITDPILPPSIPPLLPFPTEVSTINNSTPPASSQIKHSPHHTTNQNGPLLIRSPGQWRSTGQEAQKKRRDLAPGERNRVYPDNRDKTDGICCQMPRPRKRGGMNA